MNIQVRAEYACGHESRVIAEGTAQPETLRADLKAIIKSVIGTDGLVHFTCHCGRGASYTEIWVDGRMVNRTPAAAHNGQPGAIVFHHPRG